MEETTHECWLRRRATTGARRRRAGGSGALSEVYASSSLPLPTQLPNVFVSSPRMLYPAAAAMTRLECARWGCAAQRIASFPAREGAASCVLGERMFVVGGWTDGGLANDVWSFSNPGETGSPLDQAPLQLERVRVSGLSRPTPRYGHSVTACGPGQSSLLLFGGMRGGGYTAEVNDAHLLSRETPEDGFSWSLPALTGPLPRARGYHSATSSSDGRYVYVFGGIANGASLDDLHVLDTQSWSWRAILPPPPPEEGAAPAA